MNPNPEILIVEDSPTQVEALEAIPHNKYDLVFMACQMLEMDGYEVTQAIRTREEDHAAQGGVSGCPRDVAH